MKIFKYKDKWYTEGYSEADICSDCSLYAVRTPQEGCRELMDNYVCPAGMKQCDNVGVVYKEIDPVYATLLEVKEMSNEDNKEIRPQAVRVQNRRADKGA